MKPHSRACGILPHDHGPLCHSNCPTCGGKKTVTGVDLIAEERQRQIEKEGWTPEHDTEHNDDELVRAAICYAAPSHLREELFIGGVVIPQDWPWRISYWKPTPDDRIRELTKAGALIAAEIDRLLSLEEE